MKKYSKIIKVVLLIGFVYVFLAYYTHVKHHKTNQTKDVSIINLKK